MPTESDEELGIPLRSNASTIHLLTPNALRFSLLLGIGTPTTIRDASDPLVLSGDRVAGQVAWQLAANITARTHMYNSDENLRVRSFIISRIKDMQAAFQRQSCVQTNQSAIVLIEDDPINASIQYGTGQNLYLFESSNVLARIQGTSPNHEAFLVSAHFDSMPTALGTTDDGIGIASMLAAMQSLLNRHCKSPLAYDVIFNFNNGEEMDLLGGMSFIVHPWFKDIKSFMNLEGAGAAQGERSILYRANSFAMASAYMRNAPYPHGNIFANQLMSIVPSAYVTRGQLQGLDIAFYTNRYLYHTERDDINHAKQSAVQSMADNLLRVALSLCADSSSVLPQLDREPKTSLRPGKILPVPQFAYYDVTGVFGITESHQIMLQIALFLQAYSIVLLAVLSTSGAAAALSVLKHLINPAATYGRPELTIAFSVSLALAMFSIVLLLWTEAASWLHIQVTIGHTLLKEPIRGPSLVSWLPFGLLGFWSTLLIAHIVLVIGGAGFMYVVFDTALFSAAACAVLICLESSLWEWYGPSKRQQFIPSADVGSDSDIDNKFHTRIRQPPTTTSIQLRFWAIEFGITTLIPFVLLLDLLNLSYNAFPALIAEKLQAWLVDTAFASVISLMLVNMIPILSLCNHRITTCVFVALATLFWLLSTFLPSLSFDRPHKLFYYEVWNTTTLASAVNSIAIIGNYGTMSSSSWLAAVVSYGAIAAFPSLDISCPYTTTCIITGGPVPVLNTSQSSNNDVLGLVSVNVTSATKQASLYEWRGVIVGPPGSRVCRIDAGGNGNLTVVGVWIDPDVRNRWITTQSYDVGYETPGTPTPSVDYSSVVIARRAFNTPDQRIQLPFVIQIRGVGTAAGMDVNCFLQMDKSPMYAAFHQIIPDWMVVAGMDASGGVSILKSVNFPIG
eukprot:jgi/Hompol1/6169/HPOL_002180-RA